MVSRFVFCLGLLSASTMLHPALAEASDVLQIVVSKERQSISVYRNGAEIATSQVSTGKPGHSTPTGIFSVIEKRRHHKSNIYSNAPMPYMQRLTWSGIALHESPHVPSWPASHGCVRLPGDFARELYAMTAYGMHVIVSDAPVAPRPVEHAALFRPQRPATEGLLLSDTPLRPSQIAVGGEAVEVAANAASRPPLSAADTAADEEPPLRILITRRGTRERIFDMQEALNGLGFDAGPPDGVAGPNTLAAIKAFRLAHDLPAGGRVLDADLIAALYAAAGRPEPPAGQLLVRQNFKPLFEVPVAIRDPERALGTHFFTATLADRQTGRADWNALTLEDHLPDAEMKRLGIASRADPHAYNAAARALERIEIPADVRDRIERLMSAGTSLTITDNGISHETGQGTDFVTLTRKAPAAKG